MESSHQNDHEVQHVTRTDQDDKLLTQVNKVTQILHTDKSARWVHYDEYT